MEELTPLSGEVQLNFISDLHGGSTTGLMPRVGTRFVEDETIEVYPTDLQLLLIEHWEDMWRRWFSVPYPLATVLNGEAIDGGTHHGTHQCWTPDVLEQADNMARMLLPYRRQCDRWYQTRGTEAHVGKSGGWDEWVAREIGANDANGRFASNYLKLEISGILCDVQHHGPNVSKYEWLRENTARQYAKGIVANYITRGERPPDIIVRSHVHKALMTEVRAFGHTCVMCITPAFEWRTSFGYRVANMDDVSDIGGAWFRIKDGKILNCDLDKITLAQSPIIKA